jgi:hypothetical protein
MVRAVLEGIKGYVCIGCLRSSQFTHQTPPVSQNPILPKHVSFCLKTRLQTPNVAGFHASRSKHRAMLDYSKQRGMTSIRLVLFEKSASDMVMPALLWYVNVRTRTCLLPKIRHIRFMVCYLFRIPIAASICWSTCGTRINILGQLDLSKMMN